MRQAYLTIFTVLLVTIISFNCNAALDRKSKNIDEFTTMSNIYAINIIMDPGHSPNSPGALSCTGVNEYIYNDTLVNFIINDIKSNINISKTRDDNQDISLLSRVESTKSTDLFISIHHDSVQPQFIEYVNSNPISFRDKGYSIFVSRKNKYFDKSLQYAKKFAQFLYVNGLRPSKHHGEKIKGENREIVDKLLGIYYFDNLIVLKKANCPALLLEAGVIVNPDDEKKVNTNQFKEMISKSIVNSIKQGDKS